MKKASREGGIYAILANETIVYIGKSMYNLKERFKQHKNMLESEKHYGKIYDIIRFFKDQGCQVSFKYLFQIQDLKITEDQEIDERELELMELALIHHYKPIGNIQGVSRAFNLPRRPLEEQS